MKIGTVTIFFFFLGEIINLLQSGIIGLLWIAVFNFNWVFFNVIFVNCNFIKIYEFIWVSNNVDTHIFNEAHVLWIKI